MKTKAQKLWERFGIQTIDPEEAPQPLIIEVPVAQRPEPPGRELREAILGLPLHAGFDYLLKKLRFQKSILQAKNNSERHKDLRDADFVQLGIAWCSWLEMQLAFETGKQQAVPKELSSHELKLFQEINDSFTVLS